MSSLNTLRENVQSAAISRCIPWCGMKPHVLAYMQRGRQAETLIKSPNQLLVLNSEEKTRCVYWDGIKPHVLAYMQRGRQAETIIKSSNQLLVLNYRRTCKKVVEMKSSYPSISRYFNPNPLSFSKASQYPYYSPQNSC